MTAGVLTTPRAGDAAIVGKAVIRAADRLNLSGKALAAILGVSEATVSRIKAGDPVLERDRNAYQLALLVVRLYRSLDAIVGGDAGVAAAWFHNHNTALSATPAELVRSISGLIDVINYLDSRRAPI